MQPDDPRSRSSHRFATRAVHVGRDTDAGARGHVPPITQTSTFVLGRASGPTAGRASEPAEDRDAAGSTEGGQLVSSGPRDSYSRAGNPTVRHAEHRLASLEGAEAAVAFASGMGAVSGLLLSLLRHGDEVLTLGSIYSDTRTVLFELLPRFGIRARRVEAGELDAAIGPSTRLVYLETPSNPTLAITDLRAIAEVARRHGVVSVTDNTFATPYLTRPLEHGIDIVLHSATKYLGGHGDLLAGFVAGSAAAMQEVRSTGLRLVGASLEPHAAFLLQRGMSTLHLRMEAHCRNAAAVARALEAAPGVRRVHYPGLVGHPLHEVAARQMSAFGGVVAVELEGGHRGAATFVDSLRLFDHAVSLGDACSLACISASTTHASVPADQRLRDGIGEGLVRLSVGLEDTSDLVADVLQAAALTHAAVARSAPGPRT